MFSAVKYFDSGQNADEGGDSNTFPSLANIEIFRIAEIFYEYDH
jgi:hypothetical protein